METKLRSILCKIYKGQKENNDEAIEKILNLFSYMKTVEEIEIEKEIENCNKNIKSGYEVLSNVKKSIYENEQFLIIYKNKLDNIKIKGNE